MKLEVKTFWTSSARDVWAIFKGENVLNIELSLENGPPFLDDLIWSERSVFGPTIYAT